MVQPNKVSTNMGQAGLCSVTMPNIESSSPTNSPYVSESKSSNGLLGNDLQETLSQLLSTDIGELNLEEILLKFKTVINENLELKETVFQNNLALRQQLNLLVQWNQQVEEQQRQYRQTINDINNQLCTLRQENSFLRSSLSNSQNSSTSNDQFKEWDETIQNLNEQLEQQTSKLQKALEESDIHLSQRKKLEGEITLLKCDLTAVRTENERFNWKLQENAKVIIDFQQLMNEKEKNLESGLSRKEDFQCKELLEARKKINDLELELKDSREENIKFKTKSKETFGLEASQMKINEDGEKQNVKDETAMLREEVDILESALAEEKQRTSEDRVALNRMHSEMAKIKKDLLDSLEKNDYNNQYYQAKIKSIHELHDEATAKLVSYEELVGTKNDEISRLKKELGQMKAQLTELKSEGETIAVLRAQVEVYQSDFRAEREAREALATDREKLRDELRHLHTRNTQLMDELETYQRRHFIQSSGRSPRGGSEEPNASGAKETPLYPENLWDRLSPSSDKKEEDLKEGEEVDENLLYCPKCNKAFTELRPLEEHVNRCLDED